MKSIRRAQKAHSTQSSLQDNMHTWVDCEHTQASGILGLRDDALSTAVIYNYVQSFLLDHTVSECWVTRVLGSPSAYKRINILLNRSWQQRKPAWLSGRWLDAGRPRTYA